MMQEYFPIHFLKIKTIFGRPESAVLGKVQAQLGEIFTIYGRDLHTLQPFRWLGDEVRI